VTAVHALLSLNGLPSGGAEAARRVSYVDLIRLNAAVVQ
jgi:hypothetical protein